MRDFKKIQVSFFATLLFLGIGLVASQPQCDFSNTFCFLVNAGGSCPSENINTILLDGTMYSFRNFDVISFSNLNFPSGEIEGRVAVRDTFVGSGGSIGTRVDPLGGDISIPYSLVVGGNATWNNGALFPIGEFQENIYAGDSFSSNVPDLVARRTGAKNCSQGNENNNVCQIQRSFDNSLTFWNGLNDLMGTYAPNVATSLSNGVMMLTCFSPNTTLYFVDFDGLELNQITSYATTNCQPVAMWIFNIRGSNEEITFQGEPIATPAPNLYNIIGSNRIVNIHTPVQGSIVNPRGSFCQTAGTVFGSVVAFNVVNVVQVNRPISCVNPGNPTPVDPPSPSSSTSTATSTATVTSTAGSTTSSVSSGKSTTGRMRVTTGVVTGTPTSTDGSSSSTGSECVCPTTGSVVTTSVPTFATTGTTIPHDSTCPFMDSDSLIDLADEASFNEDHQCPSKLEFSLNGIDLSFKNYHVISFNGYKAVTGDIEGRLAAKGHVQFGNGFSVGDKIENYDNYSPDQYSTYSIISGSINWVSGALYPVKSSNSRAENIFVGSNTYSLPVYLESKVTGKCHNDSDCLDPIFDEAKQCYTGIQNYLSSLEDNVQAKVVYSQLKFTCESSHADRYVVSFSSKVMEQVTWFGMSNCNSKAQWVINVKGEGSSQSSGDVTFHGDSFPISNSENVLWNIIGTGRVINVGTAVNGAILAPNNYLNQVSGVIRGKVVVAGVTMSLQINKPTCENENRNWKQSTTGSLPPINTPTDQGVDNAPGNNISSSSSLISSSFLSISLICIVFLLNSMN